VVLKTELHTHTSDDPHDYIPHSAADLVRHASALGYGALAITLHDRQLDVTALRSYAEDRGVTLIPGIERTIHGKHVLLLNFPREADRVTSFDDLRRLKRDSSGLVIAPHPFFPAPTCLGRLMDRYADVFDAVEWNGMFTRRINFNLRAARWARRHGRPMVGNGDVHRLEQLGTTYSLVDAEPEAGAICQAIAAGRVRFVATPHSLVTATRLMADLVASTLLPRTDFRTTGTARTIRTPDIL